MRTLLLFRGAPGCGKSTYIKEHNLEQYVLSADTLRLMCQSAQETPAGQMEISPQNDDVVWEMLFKLLEVRMSHGEFTVIDATNSKTVEMNRYKNLAKQYRYRMYVIDMTDLPIEECKRRNAQREWLKRVPEAAIDKAAAQGLTGDEKSVKIEGAGMELKDYQQLNFKGQSLILDLNATGVSYIVICREKDETETKLVNGSSVSVSTGRKIPDGFKGQEYNVGTEFRMYHPGDDKSINFAYFDKDRTGVHNGGEVVEDLTLLEYQEYLDRSAKNREVIIKNGLNDAVKTEMKLRARELGLDDNDISDDAPAENASESKAPSLDDIKAKLNDLIASASPVKKSAAQKAVKAAGLSTAFRSMTDIEELKKVAAIMEKELA